jgi:hypothetical protein
MDDGVMGVMIGALLLEGGWCDTRGGGVTQEARGGAGEEVEVQVCSVCDTRAAPPCNSASCVS